MCLSYLKITCWGGGGWVHTSDQAQIHLGFVVRQFSCCRCRYGFYPKLWSSVDCHCAEHVSCGITPVCILFLFLSRAFILLLDIKQCSLPPEEEAK